MASPGRYRFCRNRENRNTNQPGFAERSPRSIARCYPRTRIHTVDAPRPVGMSGNGGDSKKTTRFGACRRPRLCSTETSSAEQFVESRIIAPGSRARTGHFDEATKIPFHPQDPPGTPARKCRRIEDDPFKPLRATSKPGQNFEGVVRDEAVSVRGKMVQLEVASATLERRLLRDRC